jgi:hypothetical protein
MASPMLSSMGMMASPTPVSASMVSAHRYMPIAHCHSSENSAWAAWACARGATATRRRSVIVSATCHLFMESSLR